MSVYDEDRFLYFQILWPNGKFFISLRSTPGEVDDDAQPSERSLNTIHKFGVSKDTQPNSFELQLEATRRASYVKKMLFGRISSFIIWSNLLFR